MSDLQQITYWQVSTQLHMTITLQPEAHLEWMYLKSKTSLQEECLIE
jgi:hypothetical protein